MSLPITSLIAAALAFLILPLSMQVSLRRVAVGKRMGSLTGAAFGDGEDDGLRRSIRAFGNFIEYVPLCVVLLALMEAQGASPWIVGALGAGFVVGRLTHAIAMMVDVTPVGRGIGMLFTYPAFIAPAVWLLIHALGSGSVG